MSAPDWSSPHTPLTPWYDPAVLVEIERMTRAQLREVPGPAGPVADALDDWLLREHGVTSGHHGAGLFLDLLTDRGWTVEPIRDDDPDPRPVP